LTEHPEWCYPLVVADSEALKERRLELQYQFRFRLIEFAAQVFDRGIPITGLVLVTYFGFFRPIHDLAGKKRKLASA
jgi:hypothetical protein